MIKIADLIAECEQLYGIQIVYGDTVKMKHVKRLRKNAVCIKTGRKHCICNMVSGNEKLGCKRISKH